MSDRDPGMVPGPAPAPAPPPPTEAQVLEALREVFDPELGLSVVELGLIYGVSVEAGRIGITMTLTTRGCPLHDAMTGCVEEALHRLPGVADVQVRLTFDPPWTPDRMRVLRERPRRAHGA